MNIYKLIVIINLLLINIKGENNTFTINLSNYKEINFNLLYIGEKENGKQGFIFLLRKDDTPDSSIINKENEGEVLLPLPPSSQINRTLIECHALFAEGAKWKNTENFYVDTNNPNGLSQSFIFATMNQGFNEWNTRLNQFRLIGNRIKPLPSNIQPSFSSPDGRNFISFREISNQNILAVTIVWGIFTGPISQREIVEVDKVFNTKVLNWGDATIESNVIDLLNVNVHEDGHWFGLDHNNCEESTMFPSASINELKKRTLITDDIECLCMHYNEMNCSLNNNPPIDFVGSFTSDVNNSNIINYCLLVILIIFSLIK